MPRSGVARILWITAVLLAGLAAPAVCADPPARRADAGKLVQIAEDACSGALRALQAPGLGGPRSEPLRSALQRMGKALAEIQARLSQQDVRFFNMLGTGSRTLAEVAVLWPRTGLTDPAVDRELRSLGAAYGKLRNRYGAEWLRYQTGQALSADELRRFQALQSMQAAFAARLTVLIEKARSAGDAATAHELDLLRSQANAIAEAPPTLDELLNAEVVADAIQGEYNAVRDANSQDEPEWNEADQVAETLATDPSVGFVFTANLQSGTKWTYTQVPTDVPDDVADDDIRADALAEALAAPPSTAPAVLLESSEPEGFVAEETAAAEEGEAVDGAEAAEETEAQGEAAASAPAAVDKAADKEPVAAAEKDSAVPALPAAVAPAAAPAERPLRCFLL